MPLGASTRQRKQSLVTLATGQYKATKRHTSSTNSASPVGSCGRDFGLCYTECILRVRRNLHRDVAIPTGTPLCDRARIPLGWPCMATWHRNGLRNSICPCLSCLTWSLCGRNRQHNSKVLHTRLPKSEATNWDTLHPNLACNRLGNAIQICNIEPRPISPKCPWQKSQGSACRAHAEQM